jgi:hypothetical protein
MYECPGCGQTTDGSACRCTNPEPARKRKAPRAECRGHEPGPFDQVGLTVYCDGACRSNRPVRDFDTEDFGDT